MTMTSTDPSTIAGPILEQLEQAWNEGDGAAFGAAFADESDFVNIRGEHHRGAANIGHGHQGIFDSIYAGSTVSYELDLARELTPGSILAVATSTLDAPGGPLKGIHNSRMTMVMVEQDDDWAITAFHNTLVVQGG
jgi:uncharacterized protein (TIGR02246 family)